MGGLKHCLSLRCLVASFMLISRCAPRGLSEYKSTILVSPAGTLIDESTQRVRCHLMVLS